MSITIEEKIEQLKDETSLKTIENLVFDIWKSSQTSMSKLSKDTNVEAILSILNHNKMINEIATVGKNNTIKADVAKDIYYKKFGKGRSVTFRSRSGGKKSKKRYHKNLKKKR